MSQDIAILRQIFDQANRANPWPLWARLRETPVCWQEDAIDEAGPTWSAATATSRSCSTIRG